MWIPLSGSVATSEHSKRSEYTVALEARRCRRRTELLNPEMETRRTGASSNQAKRGDNKQMNAAVTAAVVVVVVEVA